MNRKGVVFLHGLLVVAAIFHHIALYAASAPAKVVVTYGGLNERSGVLFVAKDAGIFQKYGLDAQVVNVRSGAVGFRPSPLGRRSSTADRRPALPSAPWRADWIWCLSRV